MGGAKLVVFPAHRQTGPHTKASTSAKPTCGSRQDPQSCWSHGDSSLRSEWRGG